MPHLNIKQCQVIQHPSTLQTPSVPPDDTTESMFIKHKNTVYVVGNQGLEMFAYGSPVIWTSECSSGQVSNPTPEYRVSVMPGLHWTHVWNRRSEDTVTYWRLKLSSGARLTQCWVGGLGGEGGYTKCHRIHLTQIWCLVIFHFDIHKGRFMSFGYEAAFCLMSYVLPYVLLVILNKISLHGDTWLQDGYINQFFKVLLHWWLIYYCKIKLWLG